MRVYYSSGYYDYSDFFTITEQYVTIKVTFSHFYVHDDNDGGLLGAGEFYWEFYVTTPDKIVINERSKENALKVNTGDVITVSDGYPTFEMKRVDLNSFSVDCIMYDDDGISGYDFLGGSGFEHKYDAISDDWDEGLHQLDLWNPADHLNVSVTYVISRIN